MRRTFPFFLPLWPVQKWPPRSTWILRCQASTDLWWLMESCRHWGRSPVRSGWGHRTRSTMGRQSPMPWRAVTMPSCSSTTMGVCKFNFLKGVSVSPSFIFHYSSQCAPQNSPFSCPMCVGKKKTSGVHAQSETKTKWIMVLTKSCTVALETHMGVGVGGVLDCSVIFSVLMIDRQLFQNSTFPSTLSCLCL